MKDTITIYRVKALDSTFVSVWFMSRKDCVEIIKNICGSRALQRACGSRHVIEKEMLVA